MSDVVLSAGVRQNLLSLQNTAQLMSVTQNRLATGKKVNTALDNPLNFFTSQSLNNRASDLNSLLDSIGQAQQTLDAASHGIDSLTKLVQSAKSIAQQARQVTEPQVNYSEIDQTGNADFTETQGTFTGSAAVPGTYTGGTLSFDVTVGGTTTTITTAAIADDSSAATVRDAINAAIAANPATAGHLAASVTGGGALKIDASDSDTDVTINASALSASLNLTTDASTDTTINSQNLLDLSSGLAGKSLTIQANGGTAKTITFGNAGDQISTFAELQAALAGTGVSATLTANGSAKNLTLSVPSTTGTQNSLSISGSATGTGPGTIGIAAVAGATGTASAPATDPTRANFQTQFNNLLSQIDDLAKDASYNGINLLYGDTLKVVFNENGTSSLNISGVKFDAAGLGLNEVTGTGFQANTNIDATIAQIDTALNSLRTQASNFGSNLTTVQARQDFTKNLINTLQTGADNLVLADSNEEGANMLALQTRQQLSTTALSLSAQSDQAVLKLFG